ncbi:Pyridoxal 5'-phosphate synthase subunit PdxT [Bienertia sinuspersici]
MINYKDHQIIEHGKEQWKYHLQQKKLGFVTSIVERDKSDPIKMDAWDTYNNMVIGWIMHNVSDFIKKSIMFMGSARNIWKNLEQRFEVSHGARRYHICKQLYEKKQSGRPVNEYYTEMMMLWEEMEDLTDYPPISEMTNEVIAYVRFRQKQEEEHKLLQFLNDLDEINGVVRSQILVRAELPSVHEACNVI